MAVNQSAAILALAVLACLLVGCGSGNGSAKHLHPQILHLRVMLEHGYAVDEFRKTVEMARLDFEERKADLDSDQQRKIDSALDAAEEITAFVAEAPTVSAADLRGDCSRFVRIRAYRAVKDCQKEIADYQDLDPSDSSESLQLYRLLQRRNLLILELVRARVQHSALGMMKAAEASTA